MIKWKKNVGSWVILLVLLICLPLPAIAHGNKNPQAPMGITLTPTLQGEKPTETNTPEPSLVPQPSNSPEPTSTAIIEPTKPKKSSKQTHEISPPQVESTTITPEITPTMIMPAGLPSAGADMTIYFISGAFALVAVSAGLIRRRFSH